MSTAEALKQTFEEKADLIQSIASGVGEDKASLKPADDQWSVRDVLCHLQGDAQHTFRDDLDRFLKEDKPAFELVPGELYWNDQREKQSVADLAKSTADQYRNIGKFVAGLSEEQLGRVGRIPFLKQARGSDEIKLSEWISLIVNFHMEQHINQLRALAE